MAGQDLTSLSVVHSSFRLPFLPFHFPFPRQDALSPCRRLDDAAVVFRREYFLSGQPLCRRMFFWGISSRSITGTWVGRQ